jgi:hypothetical protein
LARLHPPGCAVILLLGISSLGLLVTWSLCQAFHLQPLSSLEELGELVLGNVHLPGVHELEDGREVVEGDIFQDDDRVLGWVLLQQVLEVGAASTEDHLVGLGVLPLRGDGDVTEGLVGAEILERRDHVGLEVVPPKAKLLLSISGRHLGTCREVESLFTWVGFYLSEIATGNIIKLKWSSD